MTNVYYSKLKVVIDSVIGAFDDDKITMSEIWAFLLALGEAVKVVVAETGDFSDDDLALLKEAVTLLYDEYILNLDLPGPDFFVDPLLRNGVLPGLVEGAFRLARQQVATGQTIAAQVKE